MSALPYRFAFLICLLILPAYGQDSSPSKIQLTIEKWRPTKYGYEISVSIKNVSDRKVVLQLAVPSVPQPVGEQKTLVPPNQNLQSLDIQQFDEKLGWQSIGPCRDVVGNDTISLQPEADIRNVVPVGDTFHGWNGSVCPRRIAHLGGKIRAILYFAYPSEEAFKKRLHAQRNIVSPAVALPPMK
jgi:hypothetical protein